MCILSGCVVESDGSSRVSLAEERKRCIHTVRQLIMPEGTMIRQRDIVSVCMSVCERENVESDKLLHRHFAHSLIPSANSSFHGNCSCSRHESCWVVRCHPLTSPPGRVTLFACSCRHFLSVISLQSENQRTFFSSRRQGQLILSLTFISQQLVDDFFISVNH